MAVRALTCYCSGTGHSKREEKKAKKKSMESDNQESSTGNPPDRREKEQDREKDKEKEKEKKRDRKEAVKKDKTRRRERKRREEELVETENEMDWEDNLTGVDKLLYPEEDATDEEMVDEEGLLSSSENEDQSDSEERRKEEEDEIAKRMRTQARAEAYLEHKRAEAEARFNNYMENLAVNKLEYDAVRRIHAEELNPLTQLVRIRTVFYVTLKARNSVTFRDNRFLFFSFERGCK
jgi:hypothetical protein